MPSRKKLSANRVRMNACFEALTAEGLWYQNPMSR